MIGMFIAAAVMVVAGVVSAAFIVVKAPRNLTSDIETITLSATAIGLFSCAAAGATVYFGLRYGGSA